MMTNIHEKFEGLRRYFDPVAMTVSVSVILLSGIGAALVYKQAVHELENMVRRDLLETAELAASMTDANLHAMLTRPEQKGSPLYKAIQAPYLKILQVNRDLIYVYTVVPCREKLCLVMDASLPRPNEKVIPSGVMQVYDQPSQTLKQAIDRNLAKVETSPYTDEYGTFLSAYAPLSSGKKAGVVGVDMSIREFDLMVQRIRIVVALGFAAAVTLSLAIGFVIAFLRRNNLDLQRKFKSILENISTVVFEGRVTNGLKMVFVNDHVGQLTGYPAADFLGARARDFFSIVSDEERELVHKSMCTQLERTGKFDIECRILPRPREDAGSGMFPKPIWVRISGAKKPGGDERELIVEGYMQNISVRKATEAKVAENEKTFRQLADSQPTLLWITNVYGDTLFYNRTWLDFTGRTLDEEIDDGWTSRIHPEDKDACLAKFIEALVTEQPFQCWFRLRRKDGEYRWMLANCTPKLTSSGRCDGYIAAATDITDRKAFEATLKRTNQHLELFFKHAPAAIAVFDGDLNYVMASERWRSDYGLPAQSVVGCAFYELTPEIPGSWKADHTLCLSGEIVTKLAEQVTFADGRQEWMNYTLHPWSDEGQVMGMIAFSEVVTERKRLDDELRAYRDDLEAQVANQTMAIRRESDKNVLLRNIITSANEAKATHDALQICLDEICHFAGWPAGHCYLVDPQDDRLVPTAWSSGFEAQHPDLRASIDSSLICIAKATDHPLTTQAGDSLWADLKGVEARDALSRCGYKGAVQVPIQVDGHRVGLFEFFLNEKPNIDVEMSLLLGNVGLQFGRLVERFRQEERLRAAKEEAEASMRAKSEFLSNMSHELRTPMHAILNYAGMGLKRVATLPEASDVAVKLDKYLGNIQTAGHRLMGLLNNLLDLAKLESGKMRFQTEVHDLRKIVDQTGMELEPLLRAKELMLSVHCLTEDTQALYDHAKMMQVMVNLFSNAIKFSPPGGKVSVELADAPVKLLRGGLLCTLSDEGCGIPDGEVGHIFEAFIQSSDTKSGAGGTGLGLSICKQIVAAHGGEIWAENLPTGGARFSFTLPRHAGEDGANLATQTEAA